MDVKDKVAIITGASSGIGASLAKLLSVGGAKVVLAARRAARLRAIADECPGETLTVRADVTRPEDRSNIIEKTLSVWGRIDILINNAGTGGYGDFLDTSEEEWRKLMELNLFSPVFLTQEALPAMLEAGGGTIVNIASIGGLMAHSDKVTPYVVSKHGLVGFSRGLARDLSGRGIKVLAACPHLTDTEFFDSSPGAEEMAPVVEKLRSRMDGPDDVARGIIDQLDTAEVILFPTPTPSRAYEKHRDV